jgi:Holliday junction resolvasome RuvABC endonuclease subunit
MKMGEVERECGVVREEMRIKEDRANRLDKRVEEINALLKEEQMAKAKLEDIILEMNNKTTSQNTKPTQ